MYNYYGTYVCRRPRLKIKPVFVSRPRWADTIFPLLANNIWGAKKGPARFKSCSQKLIDGLAGQSAAAERPEMGQRGCGHWDVPQFLSSWRVAKWAATLEPDGRWLRYKRGYLSFAAAQKLLLDNNRWRARCTVVYQYFILTRTNAATSRRDLITTGANGENNE